MTSFSFKTLSPSWRQKRRLGHKTRKRKRQQTLKPLPNSSKLFMSIELKNGLTALLVSDPKMRLNGSPAAACMVLRAGSFLDPHESQGLAHFVEHMLVLGSDEFPEENNLENYLNKHGGDSNAATSDYHTSFFLHAKPDALERALEMFSRTFIAPLMKPDSMKREINAIDSEFEIRKQKDHHRLRQLMRHTSNDHSYNRFVEGNKKSLCSENIDVLLKRTKAFFDDHFHGGSMKLCVIGQDSLSDLKSWVIKYFGGVKHKPKCMPPINLPKPIWDANTLHVLKSVEGMTTLHLCWILPSYSENKHSEMPEVYILELLRNESKESLFGFFKEKGWVIEIEVSLDGHLGEYQLGGRIFTFSVSLTNSGLEKKYEMINYVYQYIKLLRDTSPQRWVWNQYWKIKKSEFDCLDVSGMAKNSTCEFAQYLSVNMLKYPIRHVVSADYVHKSWNPKAIEDLMNEFTPKNMRLDLVVNSLSEEDCRTEPWFGSHFTVEQIPQELITKWSTISEVDKSLRFPKENQFIPTTFNLSRDILDDTTDQPSCIVDKSMIKMWHQCNEVGAAYAFFCINLSDGEYSIKKQLMKEIFIELITQELRYIMFEGKQASLSPIFSICENKLVFKFKGYREKLTLFLTKFWENFKSFSPTLERFEIAKEEMTEYLSYIDIKEQSEHMMFQMLYEGSYGVEEKLESLKDISFADLEIFISLVYPQIFIEALCYGDILETEALEISKIFERTFEEPRSCAPDHVKLHPNRIKRDANANAIKKSETNSMAMVYFQTCDPKEYYLNDEDERSVMLSLFTNFLKEELYNQLRTQDQLGYDVDCRKDFKSGTYGFYIHIVSSQYNPDYLLNQIDNFLNGVGPLLQNMTEESFGSYLDSVKFGLFDDVNSHWNEIVCGRYKFDWHEREAKELETIEHYELVDWYEKYFIKSSPSYQRFSVGVWGGGQYQEEDVHKSPI